MGFVAMKTKITSIGSKRVRRLWTILICCVLIPIVILTISSVLYSAGKGKGPPVFPREDKHEKPINSDFDLFSTGKNGTHHKRLDNWMSADDIVRASNGEYVGLASEY